MPNRREVVITGLGILSPLGIGRAAFANGLAARQSPIRSLEAFEGSDLPPQLVSEIPAFDSQAFVQPRKNLKLMARDAVLAVAASKLALEDAGLSGQCDPERTGVVLGADRIRSELAEVSEAYRQSRDENGEFSLDLFATRGFQASYPLMFLRLLPNMLASHVSIASDARGPNNTVHHNEISSLAAIIEAARTIERGAADCMLAGGASSRLHPLEFVRRWLCEQISRRLDDPQRACRPFDRARDGQVHGEGAAIFVIESAEHAAARGAKPLARLLGAGLGAGGFANSPARLQVALERAIDSALRDARFDARGLSHVNAHGLSTTREDRQEALALAGACPGVPITAPKSYFGNLGAAGGAVELAASVLALAGDPTPPTLNYAEPDQGCRLAVLTEPLAERCGAALAVNATSMGQAAALVLGQA